MNLNTGIEAILAAIGVEIAKMVVEQYMNNNSNNEESASNITDDPTKEDGFN